jgi:hypothetical protein
VHAVARWIGDDYIGLTVLRDKCVVEDVFHVAYVELAIGDIVAPALILASAIAFGNGFYTNDLFGIFRNELRNGSGSGVQIIHSFVSGKAGKFARDFVEFVRLVRIGLVK